MPVDPYDYNLLTLKWKKGYFCDVYTPFGHSGGSLTCSRITGLFRYIAYKHSFTTYTYVDDVIGIGLPVVAKEGFSYMKNLLEELNFPISTSKLVSPSEEAICLGIIINAKKQTLSIPQGKLQEIIEKCTDIIDKKSVTRRQFQSVLGSLMFIHKCVKSARIFTNRLLDSLRKSSSNFIHITEDIRKDLRWFLHFTPKFNGTTTFDHTPPPLANTIAIDASLHRLGGVWGDHVYSIEIPEEIKEKASIVHFEMINILVALKIWAKRWQHKYIRFLVDNEAVVTICGSSYTRDAKLAEYVRNIWLVTSLHDIKISVIHIAGKRSCTADLLSRWTDSKEQHCKLKELVPDYSWEEIPTNIFHTNTDI